MAPTKGFAWSIAMLVFMLLEVGVVLDIEGSRFNETLKIFFSALFILALIQIAGTVLVWMGRYRLGGTLQIVASTIHMLDFIGIVGVVGGLKAYRYPKRLAEMRREASLQSADSVNPSP